MDMVNDASRCGFHVPHASEAALVTLLDTNALVWLAHGHRRAARLAGRTGRLWLSPASLLELQFLVEAGRVRLREVDLDGFTHDDRWAVDEPPSVAWFREAWAMTWTRDPFDRLIVAHARLRGWKLATAVRALLGRLEARATVPL
jgi:PIN domain nuclease of toxin-antitoxin system